MEDNIVTTVTDGINTAAVTAAGLGAWLATRFNWWKNSDSKLVKIGVPLALFICVALVLSLLS